MKLSILISIASYYVINAQEEPHSTSWDYESSTDPDTTVVPRLRLRTSSVVSATEVSKSESDIPAFEPISGDETDEGQHPVLIPEIPLLGNRNDAPNPAHNLGKTHIPSNNRNNGDILEDSSMQEWEYDTDGQNNDPIQSNTRVQNWSDDTDQHSNVPPLDKKKPNILIILADDVGTGDIPSYWNSGMVKMPNIQKIADNGVTFLHAHATPLCAPSRYMLLSGNYQHRGRNANGSWNLGYDNNQFQSHQKSIAEVLKGAGYETMMAGKWHLGAKVPPSGLVDRNNYLTNPGHDWSMPLIDGPPDIGFDYSMITTGGIQEAPYSFFRNGLLTTNISSEVHYWEPGTYNTSIGESVILQAGEGDVSWDSSSYNMKLVNETSAFIDRHLKEREKDPFFAYVALGAVHYPHSPPSHYLNGDPIAGQYPNHHLDMLLEMDHVVGSLLSMIEERNLTKDTIIIFASDNGGLKRDHKVSHNSSGPLKGEKATIWEGGHRVPLMMRYDGTFPANEKRGNLVGLNDMYATLCDLLGIKIPYQSAQDSVSFKDHIFSANATDNQRDSLAVFDYSSSMIEADSLLKGNLKLIRFFNKFSSVPSHVQLYDLEKDVSETKDLSGDPRFASVIKEMTLELKAVGPCPDDVRGFFPLHFENIGPHNFTCRFFKKNPWKCTKFIEGELNCISTCGTRHAKACNPEAYGIQSPPSGNMTPSNGPISSPSVSIAPSKDPIISPSVSLAPLNEHRRLPSEEPSVSQSESSSPSECVDIDDYRILRKNGEMNKCSWLSKKSTRIVEFCQRKEVRESCKSTCFECGDKCVDDYMFEFKLNDFDVKKKNCSWLILSGINQQRINSYCSKNDGAIEKACPFSCGTCS